MKVSHPNICRLLGVSADGPERCLVLELCGGGSLHDVLKEDRRRMQGQGQGQQGQAVLGWRQRLEVMVAIARALVFLHSQSPPMIHR